MATRPLLGAVQDHQTDLPPAFPPCHGSPGSLVALTLLPVATIIAAVTTVRLANWSFVGGFMAARALYALSRPPLTQRPASAATGTVVPTNRWRNSCNVIPGNRAAISAATPLTWGVAILVPLKYWYS